MRSSSVRATFCAVSACAVLAVSTVVNVAAARAWGPNPASGARALALVGESKFVGLNPARLMDTRSASTVDGKALGEGPIGADTTRALVVVGRGPVPTTDVGAVALNITAITPTASSFLAVWPTGASRPNASNLNFVAGRTIANVVIVAVGANNQINIYNESGRVDVAVDVLGYFPAGPAFNGVTPERFLDTRVGGRTVDLTFQPGSPLAATSMSLKIAGRSSVPAEAAGGSVALNVTVANATTDSFLTVFPRFQTRPNASNLNFRAGEVVANMVMVRLSSAGEIAIANEFGSVDVIVDVLGWFPPGPTASFKGIVPARVYDSRPGGQTVDTRFAGVGLLGPGQEASFTLEGRGEVPANIGNGSVALNVTVTDSTAPSYLTVWPWGTARPIASNLNFAPGRDTPNMVIVPLGPRGEIGLFNASGSAHVIVDVLGYFQG